MSLQVCGEWLEDRDLLLAELREVLGEHFEHQQEQVVMVPSYEELWTFMSAQKPGQP